MSTSRGDEAVVLTTKLKAALASYDSATRKYLSAVKELEASVECVAVALRQLSSGDVDAELRSVVERFCSAIDHHSSAKPKNGSAAVVVHGKAVDSFVGVNMDYNLTSYLSEFSRDVTASLQALKGLVKESEALQKQRHDAQRSLAKARSDADKREAKLAKQNRNIADDVKFSKMTAKRVQLASQVEAAEQRCATNYASVLRQRNELLRRILVAIGATSHRYYSGLADVMKCSMS